MITKKIEKILALVLCGVMALNGGLTVVADTVSSGDALPAQIVGVEVDQEVEDTVSSGDVLPEETTAGLADILVENETVSSGDVLAEETKEFIWFNDEITVKITADADVLEEVGSIEVTSITEEDALYAQLAEQLEDAAATDAKSALGFYAYDIAFLNAEETEVYPEGEVKLTVEYASPMIPAAVTAESIEAVDVALIDLDVDEEGAVTITEANGILSTEGNAVKTAVYTTDDLDGFALAWSGDKLRTLSYDDEEIHIELISTEYALQDVVDLSVTPIKAENEETQEQYVEVAQQLEEKVAEESKEVVGFLAYDITLVDSEGNKIEPSGNVRVTMEYKEAAVPAEVEAIEDVETTEVTLMHHKEDENGVVEEVVDMVAEETIEATVTTTEEVKVENAEFVTDSFSVFTITWVRGVVTILTSEVHCGYMNASGEYVGFADTTDFLKELTVSSTGTPPTLFMDTITKTGTNSPLYTFNDGTSDYYFNQAYIATEESSIYTLLHGGTPITALQAKSYTNSDTNELRYMLKDAGEYTVLNGEEKVFFVYSSASESTTAGYYLENGVKIKESKYTYTQDVYKDTNGIKVDDSASASFPRNIATIIENGNNNYLYAYTLIVKGEDQIVPTYIRFNENNVLQYRISETETANENEWIDVGTAEIQLVYISQETIETANTAGLIDIDLYDYKFKATFDNGGFKFTDGGQDHEWYLWNNYGFGSAPRNCALQGIVKNSLYLADGTSVSTAANNYKGYPVLSYGGSLAELFGGATVANNVVSEYKGLNHLFKIDENGYYVYDSTQNAAYYNPDNGNKNFTVYGSASKYGRDSGQFMPFEKPDGNNSGSSKPFPITGSKYSNDRYHFGMNVGFNFLQPKDGKINDKDMVFEFSGDDDVWVFIDGKLVLDLGGIHQKVSGSINFATGKVSVQENTGVSAKRMNDQDTYESLNDANTSLNKIFKWAENQVTFDDNSEHRLEFFYLERGAGDSNCTLRFNLPPKESNNIEVQKEITNTDWLKYSNVEFDFKLYLEDAKNTDKYDLIPQGTRYTIKKDGQVIGNGTVDENGIFTLKHGESAVFSNIHPGIKYYVEEVSVNSTEFDKVWVNAKEAEYYDQEGKPITSNTTVEKDGSKEEVLPGSTDFIARTDELLVGKVGKVLFQNRCSASNKRELIITKEVSGGGTADVTDYFTFKIYLSADGELVPYEGEYYIKEGEAELNGGSPYVTADGVVTNIKAGQSVVITGIMSDTEFKVEEIWPAGTETIQEKYAVDYTKTITNAVTTAEDLTIEGADGAIDTGKNAKVVITNYLETTYISVTKEWKDALDAYDTRPDSISFELQYKHTGENNIEWKTFTYDWDKDGTPGENDVYGENGIFVMDRTNCEDSLQPNYWFYTIDKLPITDYSGILEYRVIEITTSDVDEANLEWLGYTSQSNGTTMINSLEAQLIKRSASTTESGEQPPLAGAIFTLSKGDKVCYYGKSDANGVINWYIDLGCTSVMEVDDDIYTFREIQAPAGYMLSNEEWTLEMIDGLPAIIDTEKSKLDESKSTAEDPVYTTKVYVCPEKVPVDEGEATKYVYTYYFDNEVLYELPSTGGSGMYSYVFGGIALMLGAAYVWFRNRRKEMLY